MEKMVLVVNCGSSSIKFSLINVASHTTIFSGIAEKLGLPGACIHFKLNGDKITENLADGATHDVAMQAIFKFLQKKGLDSQITAIGHRLVHGAEYFKDSVVINEDVLKAMEKCAPLAPLHNPANLLGVRVSQQVAPQLPQVGVFDTAFHQTLPKHAYLYAVPMEWYEKYGVRRYSFHGTSHRFVSQEAASLLNIPLENSAFISAHLGNGASATAILNGKSVDSSLGFTPLEGLVMGTRSGDIDPGLHPYLCKCLNVSIDELVDMLNKKSGLLGLSGLSSDMRELEDAAEKGHAGAQIALEVFCFRIARYIGSLAVSLPRIDALIFTGGIGENSSFTRRKVIERLSIFGFKLDNDANETNIRGKQGLITTADSTKAIVVNTNEELMIAMETARLV